MSVTVRVGGWDHSIEQCRIISSQVIGLKKKECLLEYIFRLGSLVLRSREYLVCLRTVLNISTGNIKQLVRELEILFQLVN